MTHMLWAYCLKRKLAEPRMAFDPHIPKMLLVAYNHLMDEDVAYATSSKHGKGTDEDSGLALAPLIQESAAIIMMPFASLPPPSASTARSKATFLPQYPLSGPLAVRETSIP